MVEIILAALIKINQLLTSGIAITAFSLLLYALTFNLRDRVARSFAFILACMTLVASGDTLSSLVTQIDSVGLWLRVQWVGIIFLPAVYFYSSDALLATTGRPSRGRRRLVVRFTILSSLVFLGLLITQMLTGQVVQSLDAAPYLERTWFTGIFTAYYVALMLWSWVNYWRAYRRTTTRAGKRRLLYLMAGATAPAIGSFPFLLFGASVAANHHLFFWLTVVSTNLLITVLLILMAYAVAFFGVDLPDRIVRSRLFRWLMRGPVTVSMVLTATTFIRSLERRWGHTSTTTAEILVMVVTLLIMQYLITLISPWVERKLIYQGDEATLQSLQELENRALTMGDLRQFLETVLASACDSLQSQSGFIAILNDKKLEVLVFVGSPAEPPAADDAVFQGLLAAPAQENLYPWDGFWLVPLPQNQNQNQNESDPAVLLGVLAISRRSGEALPGESADTVDAQDFKAVMTLAGRAALALENHAAQQRLFTAMQELTPRVEMIQRMRAAARYDGSLILTSRLPSSAQISSEAVKDTLDHFWGGPKFTQSPLLQYQVVRSVIQQGESPQNALRSVLRQAIEQTRPAGERRFTSEWILYNILAMKYVEGHKVRDIATRLAMSEADFYRKQRAAIQAITDILNEMETQTLLEREKKAIGGRL